MSNDDTLFKKPSAALPLIAPKYEKHSPSSTASPTKSSSSSRNLAKAPRTRLPPRSRSGCWTCRTRKVKCDEQRPTCLQCSRLGHECDYGPRLSFRDDTPRVIERMQEVSALDSHAWNPSASYPCRSKSPSPEDSLPPFSTLLNDEERERKAKLTPPGTYHVIANQRSFHNLPEYAQVSGTPTPHEELEFNDPNTIVLERFEGFEEPMARLTAQTSRATINSPATSTSKSPSASSTPQDYFASSALDISKLSLLEQAQHGGTDAHLLQHYRSEISHHVVQIGRTDTAQDIFEIQARTFPPLFHAMMALSSLNLAHRHGNHVMEALEHYQKTIPTMRAIIKSPQDSFCDGAFFSHFLLLLFEIAAAEHWDSNMWEDHISQLCRIVTLRWQNNGTEKHPFLVWMICLVDTYALLSASGPGIFVERVLKQNIFPTPQECLPPLVPGQPQTFYPEEMSHFPDLLQLNQEVVLVAYQVGLLARNFRIEAQQRNQSDPSQIIPEHIYAHERSRRIKELEISLRTGRSSWMARFPDYNSWLKIGEWENEFFLAPRVLAVCEHAYTLFRAVLIYLHTSMYPSQVPLEETLPEIASCASDILLAATRIVGSGRFELRYIVFPLFIAGYATRSEDEKKLSLDLLEQMDKDSFGGNTSEVRRLLEIIHQLQRDTGEVVDWVKEMKARGLNVVIFGF